MALGVLPRRFGSVAELLMRFVRGPQINHRVQPQVEVEHADVRPDVPDLLLTGAPHLVLIIEVLFNSPPISECFEYPLHLGGRVGAEGRNPLMLFLYKYNTDDGTGRRVCGQKSLVGLRGLSPIDRAGQRLPATTMYGIASNARQEVKNSRSSRGWPRPRALATAIRCSRATRPSTIQFSRSIMRYPATMHWPSAALLLYGVGSTRHVMRDPVSPKLNVPQSAECCCPRRKT
jgi:hypothetical protein